MSAEEVKVPVESPVEIAEGRYFCGYCKSKGLESAFESVDEIAKHLKTEHDKYICKECLSGDTVQVFDKMGFLGAHVKKEHRAAKEEAPPRGLVKTAPEAVEILEKILDVHPDIKDSIKKEVLSMAELQPLNPQLVEWTLNRLRGCSRETASYVAQKFALALAKAQAEALGGQAQPAPVMQQPMQQFGTQMPPTTYVLTPQGYVPVQPQFPQQAPWQQPQAQPQVPPQVQPPYQPYHPPPAKSYKLVVDGQEIETDEKGFMAWKRYLDEQKKAEEKPPAALTKEDIVEMMDKTKTELAGALMEKLERDKAEREKETLTGMFTKLMEKVERGELYPKAPAAPQAPPVSKDDIAKAIEGSTKATREDILKFIEAKSKEEAADKRHSELLSAIRSGMAAQQVSGYKEDAYRFLGQGITAAAGMATQKTPMKDILEKGPQIAQLIFGPAPPGPKEVVPGAEGAEMAGLFGKLEPEWVKEK